MFIMETKMLCDKKCYNKLYKCNLSYVIPIINKYK